jgi:hypothetical protein
MKSLSTLAIGLSIFLMIPLPASATSYLHGKGPNNNPPTLFINDTAPSGATAKYKDSLQLSTAGGNPWKEIGTWTALTTGRLTIVQDLCVWLGLKNSLDSGTNFDLRAEVYKNNLLITSGEVYCIKGLSVSSASGKKVTLFFDPFPFVDFNGTETLSLKVLARIGTDGAGTSCGARSTAKGLRLYFDAATRPSRFDARFTDLLTWGGTPHVLFGKVLNSDGATPEKVHLELGAYVHSRPYEILSKSSLGCGYDSFSGEGWLWLEAGNYPTPWATQENLRIMVADSQRGESGVVDLVLDTSGAQLLADIVLGVGDKIGPVAYDARVNGKNPASVPGGTIATLTARLTDSLSGNSSIQTAEYFIDTDPGAGFGTPMAAKDGTFNSPKEEVAGPVNISSWTVGTTHTLYVRGQDGAGNWGIPNEVVVSVSPCTCGAISWGAIYDKEDPLKDTYYMNLSNCSGLGDVVANLSQETVRIKVGPDIMDIPGSKFSYVPYKTGPYYQYYKPGPTSGDEIEKFVFYPGSKLIYLYNAYTNVNGIENPITVKVEIGGWCCEATTNWRKEEWTGLDKYRLP